MSNKTKPRKQASFRKGEITILCSEGRRVVEAEILGDIAIHRNPCGYWSISHIPTRLAFVTNRIRTKRRAEELSRFIASLGHPWEQFVGTPWEQVPSPVRNALAYILSRIKDDSLPIESPEDIDPPVI